MANSVDPGQIAPYASIISVRQKKKEKEKTELFLRAISFFKNYSRQYQQMTFSAKVYSSRQSVKAA